MERNIFWEAIKLIHGLLVITSCVTLFILSIPIYIWRSLLSLWAKYFGNGKIGKPVTALGNFFAIEFLSSRRMHNPRCNVGVTVVIDGKVTVEEIQQLVIKKWLKPESQAPRYPEVCQYVESWMGFMFWKPDLDFKLNNHIKSHIITGESDKEREGNVRSFMEQLLNSPFHPKRSPWECYVISNYKNEHLSKDSSNGELTLMVFRFHHCFADGYSILYAILEELLGVPLSDISLPSAKDLRLTNWRKKLVFYATFPLRLVYDVSKVAALLYTPKTALHVADKNNSFRQFYQKTLSIPIERIKTIKNRLGVNFTDVLLTAVAVGLAKTLPLLEAKKKTRRNYGNTNVTQFATVLPLPGHPNKFRNHFAAAHLELPTMEEVEPLQRLKMVHELLRQAKRTTFPIFSLFFLKMVGSMFAWMTKWLARTETCPVYFSNFPGPGTELYLNGKKVLMADVVTGTQGVVGVGFMLLSFRNHFRIAVTVEEGVMDRNEVNSMLAFITKEFEILYDLSMNCEPLSIKQDTLLV